MSHSSGITAKRGRRGDRGSKRQADRQKEREGTPVWKYKRLIKEVQKIVFYPDSMKTRVVIEEFHLFCREWPQNLLNGEELETQ